MNVEITVTQEDIDKGVVGDWCRCPVARAVNRKMVEGAHCSVSQNIAFYPPRGGFSYRGKTPIDVVKAPDEVFEFVKQYDKKLEDKDAVRPSPITFTLDIPDQSLPLETFL